MRHLIKLYEDFRRAVELSQRSDRKGFSLVELLVVIAIIAILAAIAIPQYNKYRANAMLSNVQSLTKDITNLALGVAQTSSQKVSDIHCRYADKYKIFTYNSNNTNSATDTSAANCTDEDTACYVVAFGYYKDAWSDSPCDAVAIWDSNKHIRRPEWVQQVYAYLEAKNEGTAINITSGEVDVWSHFSIKNCKLGCHYDPVNDNFTDAPSITTGSGNNTSTTYYVCSTICNH